MRAWTGANGQPADALVEPDAAGDLATWTPGNASSFDWITEQIE